MVHAGDRAAAADAYKKVEETAAGSGLKMDNVFTMLRCHSNPCIDTQVMVGRIAGQYRYWYPLVVSIGSPSRSRRILW